MRHRLLTGLLLVCSYSSGALAANTSSEIDISRIAGQQSDFNNLVLDLGAALSYKAVSPAENLGLIGFDIGIEISQTKLQTDALQLVTVSSAPNSFIIPKAHAHVGIPFIGIDVGAFYTKIPDSNISVFGGEVKFEVLEGGTITPAISIRGTFSDLSGVDNFELSTRGLEASISKGFLMATPYAGVGSIQVKGSSSGFGDVKETLTKTFVGLNFNLGLLNFSAEMDKTGDNATSSIKVGFRF